MGSRLERARNPQLAWEFVKTFTMDSDRGMVMPRAQASVPAYRALHSLYLDEVTRLILPWTGSHFPKAFTVVESCKFVSLPTSSILKQSWSKRSMK